MSLSVTYVTHTSQAQGTSELASCTSSDVMDSIFSIEWYEPSGLHQSKHCMVADLCVSFVSETVLMFLSQESIFILPYRWLYNHLLYIVNCSKIELRVYIYIYSSLET